MYEWSITMHEADVREKDSGFANERKESQGKVRGGHSQAPKRCSVPNPPQTSCPPYQRLRHTTIVQAIRLG